MRSVGNLVHLNAHCMIIFISHYKVNVNLSYTVQRETNAPDFSYL